MESVGSSKPDIFAAHAGAGLLDLVLHTWGHTGKLGLDWADMPEQCWPLGLGWLQRFLVALCGPLLTGSECCELAAKQWLRFKR